MRKLVLTLLIIMSFSGLGFAQKTIEPELQNVLNQKGDEMIGVNIIFKSQIDYDILRNVAKNITDKKVRRDALVDELKLFAEKEQAEVMSILNAEAKSMNVADIRSQWMTNYINCKASRDVIYLLSQHPDVMLIGLDQEKNMLWNEKVEKAEQSKGTLTENITKINADDVWEIGYTGNGVIVAVIDTGVNYNHIDLADHLWDGGAEFPNHGYNTYDNNNDPMDHFSHGTHCAGTVCGDGTSGTSTGIAPDATLMCVKALSDEGTGSAYTIQAGMEWAIEHNADVLSLSLGVPTATISEKTLLRNTCVTAMELGVVASVACGNEGNMQWMNPIPNNVRVPGSCPPPWLHPDQADVNPGGLSCVVSVGAVNYYDAAADFTSHGPVTWQSTDYADYAYQPGIGLIRPDVCAPGVNIVSLDFASNDGFATMSGTSMACPAVAGTMALMLEKKPNLTPADVSMILETTAQQLTPNKSNVTGSGRIDALAAIEAVTSGDFRFVNYIINDNNEENGNGNANLNPLEQVKLNVTFNNDSDVAYNNVTAVLKINNVMVRIEDSIAQINSIGANETINIVDEFEFIVDETVQIGSSLGFDVYFYDENNESIGSFRVPVKVYGKQLEYSSVIIKNDDNGNGILEAGETADFGVVFNNKGNEIAVAVEALLSCENAKVTINTNEASFSSIGAESSSVAFFNITLADNISDIFSIPFEIEFKENEQIDAETFSFNYSNTCNVIFELKDDYGDGWGGAALILKFSDGTPDDALTIANGYEKTYTKEISSGVEVTLEWNRGTWDLECSFVVKSDNGTVIYSDGGRFINQGFLFSWVNDCSAQNPNYEMCEGIQNLQLVLPPNPEYPASFTWEAPAESDVLHYEIYRDSRFMGTTEELSYTDMTATGSFYYIYSVRPIYEDCSGMMSHLVADYINDVDENNTIKATIYPNPSQNEFNIVCDNMTRITVYNVMGSKIMDTDVNSSRYNISSLESGVYFINIETTDGNIVRKVVRL
ncbi:MAG: T9SS type A sorting domain-containing protein [Lentimicrobiaceae bacterium]|nr:T9SS type A sorting domain-containing protein [Lentimicrobiaceae bacterium]